MQKKEMITLGIGIAVIVAAILIAKPSLLGFSGGTAQNGQDVSNNIINANPAAPAATPMSTKQVAENGDTVSVHYTGKLKDGTVFDSSYNRGEPITFKLGAGQVIQGWDEGILGMKIGEKKHLVIPPEKGYGNRAVGPIPANSTLYFDVELVGIQ